MIKNEKQYKITLKLLAEWEANQALLLSHSVEKTPEWLYKEQLHAAKHEIKQLRAQVEEYDAIKSGKRKLPDLHVVQELPALLIHWRIRKHLTQKQLAERVGMHENQIQKYEMKITDALLSKPLRALLKFLKMKELNALRFLFEYSFKCGRKVRHLRIPGRV